MFLAAAFWHFALRKAAHAAQERKKVGIYQRDAAPRASFSNTIKRGAESLRKGDERWSMRAGVRARFIECSWRGGITPTLDAIGRQAATLFGAMASDGDAALGLSAIVGTDSTLIAFASTGFADYMLLHVYVLFASWYFGFSHSPDIAARRSTFYLEFSPFYS